MQLLVFIRKNTNIFEKQRHLCIFLDFHKTIMQQLESHQKGILLAHPINQGENSLILYKIYTFVP